MPRTAKASTRELRSPGGSARRPERTVLRSEFPSSQQQFAPLPCGVWVAPSKLASADRDVRQDAGRSESHPAAPVLARYAPPEAAHPLPARFYPGIAMGSRAGSRRLQPSRSTSSRRQVAGAGFAVRVRLGGGCRLELLVERLFGRRSGQATAPRRLAIGRNPRRRPAARCGVLPSSASGIPPPSETSASVTGSARIFAMHTAPPHPFDKKVSATGEIAGS